jgi:hypothetical protein
MKTIIHVWTHKFNINHKQLKKYNTYNEKEFYFGLGDLIRSTIKLYDLSKKMNFNLIVDLQLHPISSFIKIEENEFSNLVRENKNNVEYVCYGGLEDYINKTTNEVSYILTNDFFDGIISHDCKQFMKNLLKPTTEFQQFIDYQLSTIPYDTFNIIHYRLNDDEFKYKGSNKDMDYLNYLLDNLNKNKENNDILVTDSQSFKEYLFLNNDIFFFETKLCHLGLSNDFDGIRDTLFEFFLITNSSKIKTYCKIHTISGFVKWISQIYDIPVSIITK